MNNSSCSLAGEGCVGGERFPLLYNQQRSANQSSDDSFLGWCWPIRGRDETFPRSGLSYFSQTSVTLLMKVIYLLIYLHICISTICISTHTCIHESTIDLHLNLQIYLYSYIYLSTHISTHISTTQWWFSNRIQFNNDCILRTSIILILKFQNININIPAMRHNCSQNNTLFVSPENILFYRLSSAVEALVFAVLLFSVLPKIINLRKK